LAFTNPDRPSGGSRCSLDRRIYLKFVIWGARHSPRARNPGSNPAPSSEESAANQHLSEAVRRRPQIQNSSPGGIGPAEAFEGYWQRPDADAKALRHGHGWYFTGDTGYVDAAVTCHIGDDLVLLTDRGGFVQSSGAELDDSDALVDPRLAGRAWLRRGLA
jgi:hypothetical protein